MTKKDYVAIAEIIKANQFDIWDYTCWCWHTDILVYQDKLVWDLCRLFLQDNRNFDSEKFISYINN